MIIEPRMRGFICTTSQPKDASKMLKIKLNILNQGHINGAKKVLVGLPTGLVWLLNCKCFFGSNASTIGVFFKLSEGKTTSQGWYNSAAFEKAHEAGLYAKVSMEMLF
jgi:enoyl-[acyl-carrier protein] reductase/trans-2-enoyl-CoA reductase (NAD+)